MKCSPDGAGSYCKFHFVCLNRITTIDNISFSSYLTLIETANDSISYDFHVSFPLFSSTSLRTSLRHILFFSLQHTSFVSAPTRTFTTRAACGVAPSHTTRLRLRSYTFSFHVIHPSFITAYVVCVGTNAHVYDARGVRRRIIAHDASASTFKESPILSAVFLNTFHFATGECFVCLFLLTRTLHAHTQILFLILSAVSSTHSISRLVSVLFDCFYYRSTCK
jgi:hypothetical protein